jgi:hypothetical protein
MFARVQLELQGYEQQQQQQQNSGEAKSRAWLHEPSPVPDVVEVGIG